MKPIIFEVLPSIFPDQFIYGAIRGNFTYVITKTKGLLPPYDASMKELKEGAITVYIGEFNSYEEAYRACMGDHA